MRDTKLNNVITLRVNLKIDTNHADDISLNLIGATSESNLRLLNIIQNTHFEVWSGFHLVFFRHVQASAFQYSKYMKPLKNKL